MARPLGRVLPSPRVWVFLALLAVIALVACGSGAAPCRLMRPAAVALTLAAATLSLFDAPRPPRAPDEG